MSTDSPTPPTAPQASEDHAAAATKTPSTGGGRSPLFGCLFGLFGVLFFAALITWSLWQGIGQSKVIDTFTVSEPVLQAVQALPADAAMAFQSKLETFATALDGGTRAETKVSVAELNHLIAATEALADLRGQLSVESIRDGEIHCSICYPLNGLPWENRKRYLVGQLRMKPEITDGHPAFRVTQLVVPGKHIPEWFTRQFAIYHLLERYQKDPVMANRMGQLSALETDGDQLVLRSKAWQMTP